MSELILPSDQLQRQTRSCRPAPGSAIPRGLQLSTGKLLLPSKSMPYGTACLLVCPHCHASGRDGTIVHMSRGRKYKDGTYADNYFKHLEAPGDPTLPCYRETYDSVSKHAPGGGGPETLVHYLGAEFVGWWYDGQEGWLWEDLRSGSTYPNSSYRFDAVLTNGGRSMAVEAEVTHRNDRDKVKYLKTLDWAVLVVDMSNPEVREWLHPRLMEWDRLTNTDGDPMPLAEEIYQFLDSNNAFQIMENDYYVNNRA